MKLDKYGVSAKQAAEAMVVNGKVKIGLCRLSGSELVQVEKITASGRVYIKGNWDVKFITPKMFSDGEWFFHSKGWAISKPNGFVEAWDDTCERYAVEA